MDANELNNLPEKEGKMMLLALLKIIFFHTGIDDSSKVTLKLGEKMPRVIGRGEETLQFRTAVSCYPARYPWVCQETLSAKVPFPQCSCPVLGS